MILPVARPIIRPVSGPLNREIGPDFGNQVILDASINNSLITDDFPLLTGNLHDWVDQNPSQGNTVQTLMASQPTVATTAFGKQGVLFDSSNDFMKVPFKSSCIK